MMIRDRKEKKRKEKKAKEIITKTHFVCHFASPAASFLFLNFASFTWSGRHFLLGGVEHYLIWRIISIKKGENIQRKREEEEARWSAGEAAWEIHVK